MRNLGESPRIKQKGHSMLKESLIENHSIALNQTAASWQEAIKIGTDLLVKAGTIEPCYYDHIISNIEKWDLTSF